MIGNGNQIEALSWLGICEPFSSLSHLIGALLFLVMGCDLIYRSRGDQVKMLSVAIFSLCGLQQLLISSTYHLLWPGPAREFMLRTDVSAIFLLIAGSMTPVHAILFTGRNRWGVLTAVWTIAFGAIFWRLIFCETKPGAMGVAFFLVCGWSCAVTATVLLRRYGWVFIRPVALSGLAYTIGAIVLLMKWPVVITGVIGPHDLWHIAVLIGLALHWQFVRQFAAGPFVGRASMKPPIELLAAEPVAVFAQR